MSSFDLVLRLFLQLSVIIAACRGVGFLGKRYLGQTQVVCEMITGVMLGPSLFGWLAPEAQAWLFPVKVVVGGQSITHPSMSILYGLSQLGLVLYMFLIGLELDPSLIRGRVKSAALISGSGIVVPFVVGGVLAVLMLEEGTFFAGGLSPWGAILFLGASMSITAFPMLARILYERGLSRTRLGTVTLAAGSLDDAIAWCLLAVVVAAFQDDPMVALLAVGGGVLYFLFMFFAGRRIFRVFSRMYTREGEQGMESYSLLLCLIMLCAWFTDRIGIYAVFGSFILGAVMPKEGRFAAMVRERTEVITTTLLLPIFFVFSGLNTKLGLVSGASMWGWALLILAGAILGKGIACALAARASGEGWRASLVIGTLMNARGLMELIILNVGLERGFITETLFAVMVLMAIVTTLMASPLFRVFYDAEALGHRDGVDVALAGRSV